MKSRSKFIKSELKKIYKVLNVSFEYADYAQVDDDSRFIKIFELLMEVGEKSNILQHIVKGSHFV